MQEAHIQVPSHEPESSVLTMIISNNVTLCIPNNSRTISFRDLPSSMCKCDHNLYMISIYTTCFTWNIRKSMVHEFLGSCARSKQQTKNKRD